MFTAQNYGQEGRGGNFFDARTFLGGEQTKKSPAYAGLFPGMYLFKE